MWEITLIGDKYDLSNFYTIIKTIFSHENSVFASFGFGERNTLKIGVNDKNIINNVKNEIIKAIITINKQEYMINNIDAINNQNNVNDFVLQSIVMLGIDEEIEYARSKLKLSRVVHIRSLVRFRLSKIYALWDKLIYYINDYICGDNVYDKLLKFIASNVDCGSDVVFVNFNSCGITVCNIGGKVLGHFFDCDVYDIIISILMMSPKKIIVQLISCESNNYCDVVTKLEYVFADRIGYVM